MNPHCVAMNVEAEGQHGENFAQVKSFAEMVSVMKSGRMPSPDQKDDVDDGPALT